MIIRVDNNFFKSLDNLIFLNSFHGVPITIISLLLITSFSFLQKFIFLDLLIFFITGSNTFKESFEFE